MVVDADKARLTPVLLTFYPHPVEVLNQSIKVEHLTTTKGKLLLLEKLESSGYWWLRLIKRWPASKPQAFFDRYLIDELKAKRVHVGV